jgi:hypothetical protein
VIEDSVREKRTVLEEAILDLLNGYALVHLSGQGLIYSFDTHRDLQREPKPPQVERTIRGAKISFVEVIEDNLLLLRRNIRDQSLRIDQTQLGRRTKNKIAVVYLQDVASPKVVREVERRLEGIDIDGIVDSGYIEQLITDNRYSIFPLTQSTERPDKVISGILEGRVAILVDGSSNVLIVPVSVNELYQSPEDYFFPFWFGSFLRFFRILGNNIAVTLPGLYIALVGVNPELLPTNFVLNISGSRMGVALPLLLELLIMEFIVEIFREGSLRLPNQVSQTLGVAAGVILGIAGVAAGLVSNATLVVVIITAIASYSGPSYEIGLSWRILRYVLILAGAFLGLYGLTVAGLFILAHAAIQDSFGTSYLAPWAPVRVPELADTVIRRPLWFKRRPGMYHPQDKVRFNEKKGERNEP